ncbi:MAG: hypothetical protein ACRCTJ_04330 [Brevinema sp.]
MQETKNEFTHYYTSFSDIFRIQMHGFSTDISWQVVTNTRIRSIGNSTMDYYFSVYNMEKITSQNKPIKLKDEDGPEGTIKSFEIVKFTKQKAKKTSSMVLLV